jgi:predicted 2-oxoglutarate/Fe(II)-dependent dioxygenase YbiX
MSSPLTSQSPLTPLPEERDEMQFVHPLLRDSHADKILVIPQFLDKQTCALLCQEIENSYTRSPSQSKHARNAYHARLSNALNEKIHHIFYRGFSTWIQPFFDVKINCWEKPQPLRYAEGGQYSYHADSHDRIPKKDGTKARMKTRDRDISLIIYLSDDFVGGALHFKQHDMRIQPQAGMLVAFPSHAGYTHAAEPTQQGLRYVLVSWASVEGVQKLAQPHKLSMSMERAHTLFSGKAAVPAVVQQPTMTPLQKERADKILCLQSALDPQTCKRFVELAAAQSKQKATVVGAGVQDNIRNTYNVNSGVIVKEINGLLALLFRKSIEPFFGVTIERWERPSLLYYPPGGKYEKHVDGAKLLRDEQGKPYWERILDRDISVVLYLNDDFTGGDLIFPAYNLKIRPKPGLLVAFPSSQHYAHIAEAVKTGHRYVIVTWAKCEGTPRVRKVLPQSTCYMQDFI